jgi:hypothetical protein
VSTGEQAEAVTDKSGFDSAGRKWWARAEGDNVIGKSAGLAVCAFLLVRETVAVLMDYEQDDEQGGDQNDVSRSVHVIKGAVDFVHVCIS